MKILTALPIALATALASAQVPDNLVTENIPPFTSELRADVGRYLEFRGAFFSSWHPQRREMLIVTRFADTPQLHLVKAPGGARRQLTFLPEPVAGGSFRPKTGECIVFSQDAGGGEFFQLYRYDLADGKITRLTDGKSRNTGAHWSRSGQQLAYTSTRRNGKDNDIYVMDPAHPASDRLVVQVNSGGWAIADWSEDETKLLLEEYVSANESFIHLYDLKTGAKELLTPKGAEKTAWSGAKFARDGKTFFTTTDKGAEFQRLALVDIATKTHRVLTADIPWDVEQFDLSPDGATLAFITNEDGVGVLHLMNAKSGRALSSPKLPLGVLSGLDWHENSRDLAFTLSAAKSPSDRKSVV